MPLGYLLIVLCLCALYTHMFYRMIEGSRSVSLILGTFAIGIAGSMLSHALGYAGRPMGTAMVGAGAIAVALQLLRSRKAAQSPAVLHPAQPPTSKPQPAPAPVPTPDRTDAQDHELVLWAQRRCARLRVHLTRTRDTPVRTRIRQLAYVDLGALLRTRHALKERCKFLGDQPSHLELQTQSMHTLVDLDIVTAMIRTELKRSAREFSIGTLDEVIHRATSTRADAERLLAQLTSATA